MKRDPWLWAVLLMGACVRLAGLGERSLSYDECQQFWASQGNVLIANRDITLDPPGFAWLLHFHAQAGRGETWLRLLPCLFGILVIAAVYRLCTAGHLGRRTARAAAFFVALAPYAIRYSQSLRVYSQAMFFAAALAAVFLEATDEETGRGWRHTFFVGLLACAALLSVYGSVWLILMMVILLIRPAVRRSGSSSRRVLLALAAGALLAAPLYVLSVPVQLTQGTPASFYEDKFLPGSVIPAARFLIQGTWDLFSFFSFIHPATGIAFGALAIFGMVRLWGRRRGPTLVMLFAGSLIGAAAASAFRLYPYGGTRQMLFAAPLFYVLGAAGIEGLRDRLRGWPAIAALIAIAAGAGVFLYRYHTEPGGQEMRPVIRSLEAALQPGDRILVNKDALPQFRFYYRGDPGRVVSGEETVIRDYLPEVNRVMTAAPDVRWWLVFSHGWNAGRRHELQAIDRRFVAARSLEAHRAAAYLFVPRSQPPPGPEPGGPP